MEAFDIITHNDQVIATVLIKENSELELFDFIIDNSMVNTEEYSIISPN